jgi:choline dehydrogenase-like flavoprotein
MTVGVQEVVKNSVLQTSVCIVGGGAAGITLALRLDELGIPSVLLESGTEKLDEKTQALYQGFVEDERLHSPPDKYRQRRWGGSTTIWGGRCMPFDPIDFERRAYIDQSGWPIEYKDVARYYPLANCLVEAGHYDYDGRSALGSNPRPLIEGFQSDIVSSEGLEKFSCPTNFAHRYQRRLAVSKHVTVIFRSNVVSVRLRSNDGAFEAFHVKTLDGNDFTVQASVGIIATGGLETARLLLAGSSDRAEGIGNFHDVVGRYYMCHIAGNVGTLSISKPLSAVRHGYEITPDGIYARRRLSLNAKKQRELGVGNVVARLHFSKITDPSHRNGVLSGLFVAKRFISYEYAKRLNDGQSLGARTLLSHLRNIVADPLDTASFLTHWVTKRTLADRKFPSVILKNRTNRFSLDVHGEQRPLKESRVSLTQERDALGMPKLNVQWRYAQEDIETVKKTLDVFAEAFARAGIGSFSYDPEHLESDLTQFGAYGGHHIGTARMGEDPRTSVVDCDCQVHDTRNLFLAGSAVFPTSSQANPTLTIVAMALRLADTVARRLNVHVASPPASPTEQADETVRGTL